jgi:hypothetical protein
MKSLDPLIIQVFDQIKYTINPLLGWLVNKAYKNGNSMTEAHKKLAVRYSRFDSTKDRLLNDKCA